MRSQGGSQSAIAGGARSIRRHRQRNRLYLNDGKPPLGALPIPQGRQHLALQDWRVAVMCGLSKRNGRCLAVAWSLEWRMKKEGFAWCGNESIAVEAGLPLKAVERALKELEESGFIIRAYADFKKRRIYPAIPPVNTGQRTRDVSGSAARDKRRESPPLNAGHKIVNEGATSVAPQNSKNEEDGWVPDIFGDEVKIVNSDQPSWDENEPIPF